MLPNIWQLKPGQRVSPLGAHGPSFGAAKAPWEQIAELAAEDGWHATYDPGNPDYRVLGEDGGTPVVRQLSDSMETLRAIGDTDSTPQSVSQSPLYHEKSLGKLDALECHGRDFGDRRLFLPTLSPTVSQPYFIMAVVKNQIGGSASKYVFSKDDSIHLRRWRLDSASSRDEYVVSVPSVNPGISFYEGGATDDSIVAIGILMDGSGSKTYVNGVENVNGDVGGVDALSGFTLGAIESGTSGFWDGLIGPIVIYDGEPSTEVRQRMENLLMDLSEPESYEIPDALNIEGLGLWLDGSDETTLLDDSGNQVEADGAIYRWDDKSNNLRAALQNDSSARPIRKTAEQNGRDVVRFDGIDDILNSPLTFDIHNSSMFVVCRLRDAAGDKSVSRTHTPTTNTRWYLFTDRTNKGASLLEGVDDLNWNLIGLLGTASEHINRTNGVESTISDTNQGTTESTHIGGGNTGPSGDDPAAWGEVDIAEMVVYNRVISTAEREQVEQYLQNKWATPALP